MGAVEAPPSLRIENQTTRSHTPCSGISEGTFYSALDSASLKLTESASTRGDDDRCRDNLGVKRTISGLAENTELVERRPFTEITQVSSATQNNAEHQDGVKCNSPREAKKQGSRRKPDSRRDSAPSTRSNSRGQRKSRITSSSRTSSHQRSTSRRNSSNKVPGSTTEASRPSSKRSAKSSKRLFSSYGKPPAPVRSSSSTLPQRHAHNPFALHFKSCHLFQSAGPTQSYQNITSRSTIGDGLTSNSLPSLHASSRSLNGFPPVQSALPAMEPYHSGQAAQDEHSSPSSPYPIVPPATTIHWTSPSTRRREYAKIDKESQGIRGWWRRNAPGWCFKDCRAGFYDEEKDSDAGSVRRYRLNLPNDKEEGDDEDDNHLIDEKHGRGVKVEVRSASPKRWLRRTWSGFSGKGDL